MSLALPGAALPVLYSFRRCPYAMRARLALAVSGLPYEHREVLLRDKPPELLSASPKGTVPVLVLPGGKVIEQSLDIMLWALRQHDPAGWLAPARGGLPAALELIDTNDGEFKRHLDRYKYPNRYADENDGKQAAFALAHRASAAAWLVQLDGLLAQGGGWLLGRQASLADMATLPFVRQFAHTDAAWFAAQPWPALTDWLARFESSAFYTGIMAQHPRWQAPRAG